VFVGSRIVLVAGVGNKEEEYNETDVQQLTLLMEGKWRLIERRRSEEAILAANERFRSVLRAATAYSIIGTDPDGIIKTFNEGAELMLGYRAEEVIDKATPELIHDPGEVAARAAEIGIRPGFEVFVSAARKGGTETREWTYIRKNGSRIAVSLTVTAMRSEAGALTGFIGVAQDITERKRDEEALLKLTEELEQRVKDRTRELEMKNEELLRMNKLFVGRELRMVELKEKISRLEKDKGPVSH
jgi:PAS domain S-box-containing protein